MSAAAREPVARSLFETEVPEGLRYRPELIAVDEEAALMREIARVTFSTFEMHGVAARRRVAFFGRTYDARGADTLPIPSFLLPLREKAAAWAGVDPETFAMALINEYPPGAPIGWHRDAPQYDIVAGVSLLTSCRMKFRPYVRSGDRAPGGRPRTATHEIELEPRSGYILAGAARQEYEHHIPAVSSLRYSVTFRTIR